MCVSLVTEEICVGIACPLLLRGENETATTQMQGY